MAISRDSLVSGIRATVRLTGLGARLSPALLREAVKRLGTLALVLVIIKLVALVILYFADIHALRARLGAVDLTFQVLFLLAGLGLWRLTRGDRLRPQRVLQLGYLYEIASSLQVALLVNAGDWPDYVLPGWSPTAVWAFMFGLIIPSTLWRVTTVTAVTLAMEPLAIAILVRHGQLTASPEALSARLWPLLGALVATVIFSRLVHGLGLRLSAAREMGAYRLEEKLGEGGMGEVWRATHRTLARPAALKLVSPAHLGRDPVGATARFLQEAQLTATLQCPNTVAVYDFGATEEGTLFYVMELLDGLDLELLVTRHGPLPATRVVPILRQACRSLAEAHAKGLVHRDIKPANLFLCRHGGELDVLKVLDFGLVRRVEANPDARLTADGATTGTPAYLAPEVALGEPAGAPADLYALGCVAVWLLTGQLVFEARSAMDQVARHLRDTPEPPSRKAPFPVPPGLDALVLGCLAKSPADRPSDARALARALDALALPPPAEAELAAWWAERPGTVRPVDAAPPRLMSKVSPRP